MKLLFFLLLVVSEVALGQTTRSVEPISPHDSTDLVIATNYLEATLGQGFVRQHLVYKGHYQSVLHLITFEITPQNSIKDRNMLVVSMDGDGVETKYNTKITKADISDYYKGVPSNTIKECLQKTSFSIETMRCNKPGKASLIKALKNGR